jgi:arsenate reductase (glutaredoxin)
MLTMYGIPNCDKVKKARAWLDGHGLAYAFHDYKKTAVDKKAGRLGTTSGLENAAQSRWHHFQESA